MDTSSLTLLSNFLLVTIPALTIGVGLYMTMQSFIKRDRDMRLLEMQADHSKEARLLRLQAYERVVLFLERISPAAVISRVLEADMVNHELQLAMIRSIRSEFEHNLSQQLYISSDAWRLTVSAKDELIKAIGMIGAQIPPDASGQQTGRIMLESMSNSGQMMPNETALEFVKNEAREII